MLKICIEHPTICVNKLNASNIKIVNMTSVADVMSMYQMKLCELIPSNKAVKILGVGQDVIMHGLDFGCKYNLS